MARCPLGPHKLSLGKGMECNRCGGDLRFYVAVRDLPLSYYNEARRLWDRSELEEAAAWLHAAIKLRPGLAEAHWLLGAIEAKRGRPETARRCLQKAQELGAKIGDSLLALDRFECIASQEPAEPTAGDVEEGAGFPVDEIVAVNKSMGLAIVEVRTSPRLLAILKKLFRGFNGAASGRSIAKD
ncbi:MAG TPA: hypothetical protein VNO14_09490 [Blastocatellia bacterium]|nr:hypothetical protein [Blastocatellia bacterium]